MTAQVMATKEIRLIPGRLRITIDCLKGNADLAQYLAYQLNRVTGIKSAAANPLTGRALVYFDQQKVPFHLLRHEIDAITREFQEAPAREKMTVSPSIPHDKKKQTDGAKLQLPGIQLFNTVATGGILAGLVIKRIVMGRSMLSSSERVFNLAAMTTIISGYPILRRGIGHLVRNKKVNNDLLISIATLTLLAMRESITGLSVLWILYLSGLFNYWAQAKARRDIKRMLDSRRVRAWRWENGRKATADADKLAVGDIVVVDSGERIPVDGDIVTGEAVINEAAICGSHVRRDKRAGDTVLAGSLVEAGTIKVQATKVGTDIWMNQMASLVEKTVQANDGLAQSGEVFSGRLVPWIIGAAGLAFLCTRDFQRSLAILLAGCPAAVALSSHTALGMAVAKAAKQGILVKNTNFLEIAEQTDTVLFDKTGTLTAAKPHLVEIDVLDKSYCENEILALAAAAESASDRTIIRTFADAANQRGLALETAIHSETVFGRGIKATVGDKRVLVGSQAMVREEKIRANRSAARAKRMEQSGSSVVYISVNNKVVALAGIRDSLHATSREAVENLRNMGIEKIGLITGDSSGNADTVSKELGLEEQWGELTPEGKAEVIKKLRKGGRKVVMVGDGINDSLAMAEADLGIATGAACTEAAIKSADIITLGNDPRKVAETIGLGKRAMQVMRQNLALTVGISVVGIALAAATIISPVTAALLQNVSTFAVVANSAKLLRDKGDSRANAGRSLQPGVNLQRFSENTGNVIYMQPGMAEPHVLENSDLWYSMAGEELCERFNTSLHLGLQERDAALRLQQYGQNLLVEREKPTFRQLFRDQFKDFMVKVLIGAAGLSFALGKTKDALLTVAIIVANAFLGVVQERKADASIGALQQLAAPMVRITRDSHTYVIKAKDLVPGDIIHLEAGDKVPADARILASSHFEVEEASLTGEPIPVKKSHLFAPGNSVALGDRKNMVYMGTSVTRGRAQAVVVATGMSTEIGKIAAMIQQTDGEITPLQRKLEELGRYLVYGCLGVFGLVFAAGLVRGVGLLNMMQTAASLAVAAIPEGLSAIVIIALAMGAQRMAKHNIIVRKMASIETLGCATVICSDKTGTLTKNQMTVRQVFTGDKLWKISGEGYAPKGKFSFKDTIVDPAADAQLMQTLLIAGLCNNARLIHNKPVEKNSQVIDLTSKPASSWSIHGDPTEGALVVAAAKAGLSQDKLAQSHIRCKEIPFESERRMMSVVCSGHDGKKVLYAKGAPDSILAACTQYLSGGKVLPLDEEQRRVFEEQTGTMATQALRVLGAAYRDIEDDRNIEDEQDALESNLIFAGLVGMIDPPRPEVPGAIAKCHKAGVKVVMITGDHPNTAKAISRELGLLSDDGKVLTGPDIEKMTDRQLAAVVEQTYVYARTAPQQKLRIVKALKEKGYVVAMTGDGVNDAPAVKAADIGIAMGIMGTEVTKEAAGMTLSDDNFATIVRAMEEGRSIYANIRKAIRYLVATNIGEVILMLAAALIGFPLPLIPIQLLWINLVGDGLPAIALVNDPPAQNIMQNKPASAQDSVFAGGLGRKVLSRGLIIGIVSVAFYAWRLVSGSTLAAARTIVLAELAISQFIHIFDCRLEKQAGKVGLVSNLPLVGAVGLSMLMVVAAIHLPGLQPVFGTTALTAWEWLMAVVVAAATAVLDYGADKVLSSVVSDRETYEPCKPAPMPAM